MHTSSRRTLALAIALGATVIGAVVPSAVSAAGCLPMAGMTEINYVGYVRAIQEELPKHGYNAGPVDGVAGPATKAAIRRYQRDAGLRVDGCVTREVMDHMLFALPKVYASERVADTALEREIQQELAMRGYYTGRVDGRIGPLSRDAIVRFQSDAGLAVNPGPSRSLLNDIRSAAPSIRAY